MNNNNYIHSMTNDNQKLIEFNKKYNLDIKDLNLGTLSINGKNIKNDGLKYLCENLNLTELKKLGLDKNYISDIKVFEKVNFEKLEILNLRQNFI